MLPVTPSLHLKQISVMIYLTHQSVVFAGRGGRDLLVVWTDLVCTIPYKVKKQYRSVYLESKQIMHLLTAAIQPRI